jgi:hypothetical protein
MTIEGCVMEKQKFTDIEVASWVMGDISDKIEVMKKMQPNRYVIFALVNNIESVNSELKNLKERGLDIGEGKCKYGYEIVKLEIPTKERSRQLIVYRREYNDN